MGKKKIYFDVINSVKGGSGKSTVSLLLAACLKHTGASAYIIDLDLHGSSWYSNFFVGSGSGTRGPDTVLVNNWMEDAAYSKKKDTFAILKIEILAPDREPHEISAAIVNPFVIDLVDEVETDLFERAIFQIIDKIISEEASKGSKPVHIVMDMPPSNEVHAERILNQLLLDAESPLMQKFVDSKDSYASFSPYLVHLIMLSPVSGAHLDLNKGYFTRFVEAKTFSSRLDEFVSADRFRLMFWGNDAVGGIKPSDTNSYKAFLEALQNAQTDAVMDGRFSNDAKTKILPYSPIIIPHDDRIKHDIYSLTKATQDEPKPIPNEIVKNIISAVEGWK